MNTEQTACLACQFRYPAPRLRPDLTSLGCQKDDLHKTDHAGACNRRSLSSDGEGVINYRSPSIGRAGSRLALPRDEPACNPARFTSCIDASSYDDRHRLDKSYGGSNPRRCWSSRPASGRLSEREIEVLRLVAAGNTNHAIATQLYISERTAHQNVSNVSPRSRQLTDSGSRVRCSAPLPPDPDSKPTLKWALGQRPWTGRELTGPDFLKGETATKIINVFLRRRWTGQFRSKPCSHVDLAPSDIGPASEVCGKCVALGDSWPALRMCLLCGHVGCCDKSKNKHAREHFRQTGHPLTRPYKERGMDWVWCYVDEALLDPI
jgi:Zn-finger in ubiquitin-hydrolases and other protein/Bacterial regulatory proteins, luxR family